MNDADLLLLFRTHGDRTSSLAALGPQFSTFAPPGGGAVRYVDLPGGRAAAGEPLCPPEGRAAALAALARDTRGRLCVMPCGQDLALELRALGFSIWQAGSEPVFDLAHCLPPDPLLQYPLARTLSRRGGVVREVTDEVRGGGELHSQLGRAARLWREDKGLDLGFLTRCAPLDLSEEKRYFALSVRDEIQAFLAAAPYCRQGRTLGWYFQDLLRLPQARAGACDLLVLESMRLLQAEGAAEVRLGLAPLARIAPDQPGAWLLGLLFRRWRLGYNFRSLHEFKDKFFPTRWIPLYLASTSRALARTLADAVAAHLPGGLAGALGARLEQGLRPGVRETLPAPPDGLLPKDWAEFLRRTRCTTCCVLFFLGLHLLRLAWPPAQTLYEASAYVPGNVTWQGLFLGPLFHNHWLHLLGDQLSLYVFGSCLEILLGPGPFLLLLALGLWLSNPLTHALLAMVLPWAAPAAWAATLAETDYGSSNAVFALAGALAGLLRRGSRILVPFALYGLFICLNRESWLALHHLVTLAAGLPLGLLRGGRSRARL